MSFFERFGGLQLSEIGIISLSPIAWLECTYIGRLILLLAIVLGLLVADNRFYRHVVLRFVVVLLFFVVVLRILPNSSQRNGFRHPTLY